MTQFSKITHRISILGVLVALTVSSTLALAEWTPQERIEMNNHDSVYYSPFTGMRINAIAQKLFSYNLRTKADQDILVRDWTNHLVTTFGTDFYNKLTNLPLSSQQLQYGDRSKDRLLDLFPLRSDLALLVRSDKNVTAFGVTYKAVQLAYRMKSGEVKLYDLGRPKGIYVNEKHDQIVFTTGLPKDFRLNLPQMETKVVSQWGQLSETDNTSLFLHVLRIDFGAQQMKLEFFKNEIGFPVADSGFTYPFQVTARTGLETNTARSAEFQSGLLLIDTMANQFVPLFVPEALTKNSTLMKSHDIVDVAGKRKWEYYRVIATAGGLDAAVVSLTNIISGPHQVTLMKTENDGSLTFSEPVSLDPTAEWIELESSTGTQANFIEYRAAVDTSRSTGRTSRKELQVGRISLNFNKTFKGTLTPNPKFFQGVVKSPDPIVYTTTLGSDF